jgi:hypothetical protein
MIVANKHKAFMYKNSVVTFIRNIIKKTHLILIQNFIGQLNIIQ